MESITNRNRRIVKNTGLLYIRTLISLIIGLYTSRILLEALGIDNYGIYNVIGGIVSFSTIIVGTMSAACSRYITFSLGEGVMDRMKSVFSTSFNVHILLAITAFIALELIGGWFLNHEANIPLDRISAANWVLQCSIAITCVNILAVPYNATIIAHEEMTIYAYLSILDAFAKLGICYLIILFKGDRLILYSILLMLVSIFISTIYGIYCHKQYEEVCYRRNIDKLLLKELGSYSGWNLLGNTMWVINTQGINMLINVFFGVAFNAGRGIANSVNNAVQGFVNNFTTAFSPQITKSYALKEYDYCYRLVNLSGKYTWFLMLLFIVPISLESETILKIWLKNVPPMASIFLIFTLFESLSLQVSGSLFKLIQATGKMKIYSLMGFTCSLLLFPVTIFLYKKGMPVWTTYPIAIFLNVILILIRLKALSILTNYNTKSFCFEVLVPGIKVSIISYLIPVIVSIYTTPSIVRFFITVPLYIIITALTIYALGLNPNERGFVKEKIQFLLHLKK